MARISAGALLGLLAALALVACSGSSDLVAKLQRVASIERGKPALVFVYTSG